MVLIRKAEYKDIPYVAKIYNAIHDAEEAGTMIIGWNRKVYPTVSTASAALSRGDLYVLELNGLICASAIINSIQVPEYSGAEWKYPAEENSVLVLHTLTVAPQYAGHGLGQTFVRFYEEEAKEKGKTILRMDTNEKNVRARRLYSKLGYREAGVVSCCFNGIPGVNLICLEKSLKESV